MTLLKALVSWNFSFDNIFIQIFRFAELKEVMDLLKLEGHYPAFLITAFFVVAFVLILGFENTYEKIKKFKPNLWYFIITLFLFTWCVFSFAGISEFLYFNF